MAEANAVAALQRQLRAEVITREHPAYERARRVWNGMIDRRPLLVAQPETAGEVAAAVAFAREQGLPLSIKGGGHGVAGRAVCDDGVVIDLARMGGVEVDPAARVARVQGGAVLRALDAGAQAHGLATTAGIYRGTGVAGLMLGGGLGLLMRRYGLTCDNVLAAEVVTAEGRILEASETEHPDLFWGLRGGGGNFGVVTRMDFRLHPLGHAFGGRLVFDFSDALAVGRCYRDLMADAPDELQAYLGFSIGARGDRVATVFLCHSGSEAEGAAVLERFRRVARPVAARVGWVPYLQLQQTWDDSFPEGLSRYWKSSFLSAIGDEVLALAIESIADRALPSCDVDFEHMGGAIARVPPDATAFADRDAACTFLVTTVWSDPAETEARIRWARETWTAAQPYAKPSTYTNYFDQGDEARTEASYGGNFARLVSVKRAYDPDNVFRPNVNILP